MVKHGKRKWEFNYIEKSGDLERCDCFYRHLAKKIGIRFVWIPGFPAFICHFSWGGEFLDKDCLSLHPSWNLVAVSHTCILGTSTNCSLVRWRSMKYLFLWGWYFEFLCESIASIKFLSKYVFSWEIKWKQNNLINNDRMMKSYVNFGVVHFQCLDSLS